MEMEDLKIGICEVVGLNDNNLSRWIILYELLIMGFGPFEAVIITSIAATSLSYVSINIISRRNKIFSSLKKNT